MKSGRIWQREKQCLSDGSISQKMVVTLLAAACCHCRTSGDNDYYSKLQKNFFGEQPEMMAIATYQCQQ